MCVTAKLGLEQDLEMKKEHHKLALHSEFMAIFGLNPWVQIQRNTLHYENTPMQYTAIFHGCKNVHFQIKFSNIFLIFAQNIDCGYTLEPPQ